MAISPYDQETRQRAVRLYFEELTDGASSKPAALRAVEAVIGIKASTIRNWVRAEEKKVDGSSPREWCICPFDKTSSVTTSRTITS
jgi:transposase